MGTAEGWVGGVAVGEAVGEAVGFAVGPAVGEAVGDKEGAGVGLAEAKRAIEAVIAEPDRAKHKRMHALHRLSDDAQGAGVRDLIAEGKLDEAAAVYAQFMGVDAYTARAAIEDMAQELQQSSHIN